MFKKNFFLLLPLIIVVFLLLPRNENSPLPPPSPTATASPVPSPTPRPLSFSEMNQLYGPCLYLPVLLYHHIQDPEIAKANRQTSITVTTAVFKQQLHYLSERGYKTVLPAEIATFFDSGTVLAGKNILLTFDDGYQDFYDNALPLLKEYGFKALVFLPTGLMDNTGYLSWGEVQIAAAYGISFGNHTWSHKSVLQNLEIIEKELSLADSQLAEKGLNQLKVFAYPYGGINNSAVDYLRKLNYGLAFTTRPGSVLCRQQRMTLPRIRVGNSPLSAYGL